MNNPAPTTTVDVAQAAVEDVVTRYLDALYACDVAKLRDVFHPRAVYATADETPLLFRDLPTYLEVVEMRESPASRGEVRNEQILSIETAGKNTARATVRCVFARRDFVDFLTLVRTRGRWQILSKVFHFEESGD